MPVKNLPTFLVLWLLILPSVHADEQITPNPNPAGNTITLDAPGWVNYTTFSNSGTIQIVANPLGGSNKSGLKNYAGEAGAAAATETDPAQANAWIRFSDHENTVNEMLDRDYRRG